MQRPSKKPKARAAAKATPKPPSRHVKAQDRAVKALGARIVELRKVNRLSQEQLAEGADIHRVYMSGVETGARNPSFRQVVAIAIALGVPLRKFLDFEIDD